MDYRGCDSCVDIDLVKDSLNCRIESAKTATDEQDNGCYPSTPLFEVWRGSLVNEFYNVRLFPNFIAIQIDSKQVAPSLIDEGLIQSGDSYKVFQNSFLISCSTG